MIGTQRILNQSKSIVKFHDPYSRLNQRAKIDHIIQNNPKFHQLLSIDLAPLLDAVIKRGLLYFNLEDLREYYPDCKKLY